MRGLSGWVRMSDERIVLLERVAEEYLEEHRQMKNFLAGFGPKSVCGCPWCEMARKALSLKERNAE